MIDKKDIELLRNIYYDLATREDGIPMLVMRYKFAVNLCDHILQQQTTFIQEKDFKIPTT